jgi:hypothetical protein
MLTSQLGIRLILLLGQSVPLPAPREVLDALQSVTVTNDAQTGDGFQITFSLSKTQPTDYSLLQSGALSPSTRVIIGVLLGVKPEVLIDGIITHHQHAPSNEPGQSTLTITGKDVSVMLEVEEKNEKHENQPDSIIVTKLIASYAKYGLVPQVTPNRRADHPATYSRQRKRRRVHQAHGPTQRFRVHIEPLTFSVNTAYWGKGEPSRMPQPKLTWATASEI